MSLVIEGREDRLTPLAGTAILRELDDALGISRALLLLGRTDIEAIQEIQRSPEAVLDESDLDRIQALIRTQIDKQRRRAATLGAESLAGSEVGTTAAGTAAALAGMKAGAAIGTVLLPGLGTVVAGLLGASFARLKGQHDD